MRRISRSSFGNVMKFVYSIPAILAALVLVSVVLLFLKIDPVDTFRLIWEGSAGSPAKFGYSLTVWVPVILCCAGLCLTFTGGLWNIGIEGQIVMGAILTTGIMRVMIGSAGGRLTLIAGAFGGAAGGAIWAFICYLLRRYGGINEIFSGLGLNFMAGSLTVYLVLGPWKRAGIGSTSGTEPFAPEYWLPGLRGLNISLAELVIAVLAVFSTWILLVFSRWGLEVRAAGLNPVAARRLGVSTETRLALSLIVCGVFAGLAGFVLVTGASARHNLFPLISGGFGYTAILIVLLAGGRIWLAIPVSLLFAMISMGSVQLSIQKQLDSAIGGLIQGLLVVIILLFIAVQRKYWTGKTEWTA